VPSGLLWELSSVNPIHDKPVPHGHGVQYGPTMADTIAAGATRDPIVDC